MNIGFYHHGAAPSPEVAKQLADKRIAVCGRNANDFSKTDKEKFSEVVVDDGVNTDAIREVYEAVGIPVRTVDEFLNQEPETPATGETEARDPDAPRQKRGRGRNQGTQ